jgi:putative spermidine/putrescine transport system ATP-binding protein
MTVVYVTHDQAEAMSLGDRIVVMIRGRVAQVGRPREIYFAPANRFVADFVGTMNVIRGVARDGYLELRGGRLPWAADGAGDVEALFRPESARIVGAPGASLSGRVLTSFFLGDRTRVVVDGVGESALIVETTERREFVPGEPIHLSIDPGSLLRLDP